MKKFLKAFLRKRVQGALVILITFMLQQFDAVNANEVANAIITILQAMGAFWGVYGLVDAHPGKNEPV